MIVQKITLDLLEKMKPGAKKTFTLPSWKKARSGQSLANQQKRATFGTKDYRVYSAFIGDPNPENGQTPLFITRLV